MSPPPIDLWSLAEQSADKHSDNKLFERTAIFLGEANSGKSSIISLIKGVLKDETPKPTSAIDYSFARRNGDNRKEIVHFYEVAGGRFVKDLNAVPLTEASYQNSIFVIVLDMENPGNALDSLIFWCENIKINVEKNLSQIFANNEQKMRDYKEQRAKEFESSPERNKITPFIVNTIVLANKYDCFELEETENRKWMSRILRYYCHINGLSLFFSSIINSKLSAQISTLMKGILFSDTAPNVLQKDHMKPIFITKGLDSIESIGIPSASNINYIDMLKKLSKEYYPLVKDNPNTNLMNLDFSKYKEVKIDGTKLIKDKEMKKIFKKYNIEIFETPINDEELNNERQSIVQNDDDFEKIEKKTEKVDKLVERSKERKDSFTDSTNKQTFENKPIHAKKFRPNLNLNKNF